jgi:hypothetical protein
VVEAEAQVVGSVLLTDDVLERVRKEYVLLAWVPWDRPRRLVRPNGVSEGAALRSFRVRVTSTCRGTPGPY